jgi:hypothetical protein
VGNWKPLPDAEGRCLRVPVNARPPVRGLHLKFVLRDIEDCNRPCFCAFRGSEAQQIHHIRRAIERNPMLSFAQSWII